MEFEEQFVITDENEKMAKNILLEHIDNYLNDKELDAVLLTQIDENDDLDEIYLTYLELYNSKKISILSSKIKCDLIDSTKNVILKYSNKGNELFSDNFQDVDFDEISIQLAKSILNLN